MNVFNKCILLLIAMVVVISCDKEEIKNTAPTIAAQSFNASEAATDADIIGTVIASDVDGDKLSYNLSANSGVLFEITTSGEISLASGSVLDYETATVHTVMVQVSDGTVDATATVTINVIDVDENTAPSIQAQPFTVSEDISNETIIGDLVASDADGDALTYSISTNDDDLFEIESGTSDLRLSRDKLLDFEKKSSHTITVTADDGMLTASAVITITVTDVNEKPLFGNPVSFTVAEDLVSGTVIGNVTATDPEGETVVFSLVPADSGNKFSVAADGTLSLHPVHTLDYETATFHNVSILAKAGGTSTLGMISITVTDVDEGMINTTVSTFAGAPGTTDFEHPKDMVFDAAGSAYVTDSRNHRIRKITAAGAVSTFVGDGTAGHQDGTGVSAQFNSPYGLAIDASDNLYVTDQDNHVIRKVTPAGVVTTFAGTPEVQGHQDGTSTNAQFAQPAGLDIDASGNLYVAEPGTGYIRKISPTGSVTSLAGSGLRGYVDGMGSIAQFSFPADVAVDGSGNVFVADNVNNVIRKVSPTGVVSTFAGAARGYQNGSGTSALFAQPVGIDIDASGNLYVCELGNNTIRRITSTAEVIAVAGVAGQSGYTDGIGAIARFKTPLGVSISASGDVYIADRDNNCIRKITIQ